jgi:hypothetical protein
VDQPLLHHALLVQAPPLLVPPLVQLKVSSLQELHVSLAPKVQLHVLPSPWPKVVPPDTT